MDTEANEGSEMELNPGKTYVSNNPCLPGQLFHVTDYECAMRFGKENVIVTYERWAFSTNSAFPYKIETTKDWLLDHRAQSFLGAQLPEELQVDFVRHREAVLATVSMIP